MKLNQTIIGVGGQSVITTGITLQSMSKENILKHLGVTALGPMDGYRIEHVHGEPVVSVSLAQEAAWTYITHVFTLAFQRGLQ